MAAVTDKVRLSTWAQQALERDLVILDTETTGLRDGEIVQIAVIDKAGAVLLDTLVKPVNRIPQDAIRVHGISDAMVRHAPTWPAIADQLLPLVSGKHVIIYNSEYDRKMIRRSCFHAQIPEPDWNCHWHCAMVAYAQFYGAWDDYRQSYSWQKLTNACAQCGIPESEFADAPAHSAIGDCLRTLAILKAMAAYQ